LKIGILGFLFLFLAVQMRRAAQNSDVRIEPSNLILKFGLSRISPHGANDIIKFSSVSIDI